jgi:hypothetical protein
MAPVNALHIGPADHGRRMSLEKFREAVEEGGDCALVRDGDAWVEHRSREEQQARSTILPGLAIRVSELWVEEDGEAAEGSGDGEQV